MVVEEKGEWRRTRSLSRHCFWEGGRVVLLVGGWIGRIGLLLLIGISRTGIMCSIGLPFLEELAIVYVCDIRPKKLQEQTICITSECHNLCKAS